tara:strand:- start:7136 stop:8809 length:1674 start_codon:yes stop_codon:yes gene_type:complete
MKLIRTMLPVINALPRNLKNRFYLLLFLTVISTVFEILILSLLYPFINSFLDSSGGSTETNFLMDFLGISFDNVPIVLGFIIVIGAALKITYVIFESRLAHKIGHVLGEKIFVNTLNLDYAEHKKNNSSFFIALIVNKVNVVVYQGFLPIFRILNGITLAFSVLIYLFFFQPILTISIISGIVLLYIFYVFLIKSTISKSSHIVNDNQNLIIKIIQDSLGSIKEIILSRSYKVFTKNFSNASLDYKMAQSLLQIISNLPKLIVEPAVMLLFIFALYFFKGDIDLASFIVVFLGLIRILPSFQVIYYNFQTFYNGLPSIMEFHNVLIKVPNDKNNSKNLVTNEFSLIEFKSINYKIDNKVIISNLNLKLKSGQKIGIFGKSGSGKSTFVDLLMGLINPSSGEVIIDGKVLDNNSINNWFSKIGHVKQDVFLIDDTIKKNIAFGIDDEFIDDDKVLNSLELAGLQDLMSDLEKGIESPVGENGAFVSGGQRQRMGLARLFYFNKNIIVLDEATSALDYKTEASILEKIYSLGKEYTIIMISHRVETLKNCDVILEFPLK